MAILKPPMLALLSNGGSSSTPKWTVSDAGFQANEELVDVLTCTKMNADSNGGVTVQGSGGSPQVRSTIPLCCAYSGIDMTGCTQVLIPTSALSTAGTTCSSLATVTQTSSARGWVDGAADSLPVLAALVLAVWAAQSSLVL